MGNVEFLGIAFGFFPAGQDFLNVSEIVAQLNHGT